MPKYWFQQKRLGYGPAPNTWQGWAFMGFSCLAVFSVILSAPAIRNNLLRGVWVVVGLSLTVLVTVAVSRMKTEGGWRWRNGQD